MNPKRVAARLIRKMAGDTLMVRSLEHELILRLQFLSCSLKPGSTILDIGVKNALYRSLFPYTTFHTLDVEREHQPDVVADVHEMDKVAPPNSYDAILCTEVLEHTRMLEVAVEQMRKGLNPGGILLASTPLIIPYHPDPQDYWRMTAEGWNVLTERASATLRSLCMAARFFVSGALPVWDGDAITPA